MLPEIRRILYATDLSESARHALGWAAALGRAHHADVTLLHVVPDVVETMSESAGVDIERHFDPDTWERFHHAAYEQARAEALERVRGAVQECIADMADCPLSPANVRVAMGRADERILEAAEELGADLVVLGTHGRSGIMDAMLGGVAHRVVRKSPVPVLTVRLPEDKAEPAAQDA